MNGQHLTGKSGLPLWTVRAENKKLIILKKTRVTKKNKYFCLVFSNGSTSKQFLPFLAIASLILANCKIAIKKVILDETT